MRDSAGRICTLLLNEQEQEKGRLIRITDKSRKALVFYLNISEIYSNIGKRTVTIYGKATVNAPARITVREYLSIYAIEYATPKNGERIIFSTLFLPP
jgi:hypothetical protein